MKPKSREQKETEKVKVPRKRKTNWKNIAKKKRATKGGQKQWKRRSNKKALEEKIVDNYRGHLNALTVVPLISKPS